MPRQYRRTDLAAHERGADRDVTARQPLRDRHDVRDRPVVLEGPPRSAAPGAAHDLVGDQKDLMAAADRGNRRGIAGRRGHGAAGGTDDRLEDEACDPIGADLADSPLEFVREVGAEALR